jgi:hypothetical protein
VQLRHFLLRPSSGEISGNLKSPDGQSGLLGCDSGRGIDGDLQDSLQAICLRKAATASSSFPYTLNTVWRFERRSTSVTC